MLFGTTKIILYLDLDKVVVADCRPKQPIYWEIAYNNTGDLVNVFDKIIRKFVASSYKIILNSATSYTVRWDKVGEEIPSRDQVRLDLGKEIPESFEDSQFDWKIIDNSQIEAIVITTPIFQALQKIRSKYSQLRLETQSELSLKSEMGSDSVDEAATPELFRFASSKGSQHGSDQNVLNVNVRPETQTKSSGRPLIILLLKIILGSIYFGWRYWASSQPTLKSSPTPSFSPSPTPIPLPKQASDFTILIQNGTTKTGLAAQFQTNLQAIGFSQVETGNAETKTIVTSKIVLKEALPDAVQQLILTTLSPRVPEITIAPDQFERDIVIILGTN